MHFVLQSPQLVTSDRSCSHTVSGLPSHSPKPAGHSTVELPCPPAPAPPAVLLLLPASFWLAPPLAPGAPPSAVDWPASLSAPPVAVEAALPPAAGLPLPPLAAPPSPPLV